MSDSISTTALQAARAGGRVLSALYGQGIDMRGKIAAGEEKSYDLVSEADVRAEEAVVEAIRRAFPSHAVLGEEGHDGDPEAEHLWVVDPLDGTNNFAHDLPHFAVSVAYYRRGAAECGVVYNPIRGDLFTAERGRGARRNGEPVRVGGQASLTEVLVGVGFYYDRGAMMEATLAAVADLFRLHIHGIRRFGTAALDLCLVGSGSFGAFFEYELSPWDFAAGRLFVEEAGGRVTDCRGGPLPLAKTSVLATNGLLHEAVLEVVQSHAPGKPPA